MQLSDRLSAIADYVSTGEKMADIGTDHGLLPIFLYKNKISPHVVLSDIKSGPLEKAVENLRLHGLEIQWDIRKGGGLDPLQPGEVDTVVIAGMGGHVIIDILNSYPEKTRSFKKFILQPRNAQDKLRMWLYNNGYKIIHERLVRERHYICEILVIDTFIKLSTKPNEKDFKKMLSKLEFEISPILFSSKDPLLKEFIECKILIEERIIRSVIENGSVESRLKLNEKEGRLKVLQELFKTVHR